MQVFGLFSFLMLIGFGACLFGYHRWKGKMHGSYFIHGFIREANYLAIPIGISLIILAVAILPIVSASLQPILISIAILIVLLSFFMAWWLFKPNWVKWIEQNYKEVVPYLAVEIRDYGWHVETQEELEEWIMELYKKYDLKQ